jgi:sphingolipid delta-4 desaturase
VAWTWLSIRNSETEGLNEDWFPMLKPGAPTDAFMVSASPEPHSQRTRAILKDHPEIRNLVGKNPWTGPIIVGLVASQFGMAWAVSQQPWWVAILAAYGIGAFIGHALFVLMHDTSHNLVFRKRWINNIFGFLCAAPSLTPSASSFQKYHLKHHSYQGVHELDADLPSDWEANLVGNSTLRKIVWLLLYPFFMTFRTPRLKEIQQVDRWGIANLMFALIVDACVIYFLGWIALLYLFCSMVFSLGLHPVGGRWIQEHYVFNPPQETYSYYGPLNRLAFNVGYHNEHHDFPSVPWNRLPEIKRIAPEYYDDLYAHRSWGKLVLRFLFDPSVGLHSRVVRTDRSGGLHDSAKQIATVTENAPIKSNATDDGSRNPQSA